MNYNKFFVDFHSHVSLRALNTFPSGKSRNLWDKTFNPVINTPIGRWARFQTREIAKESQSNLYDYQKSKTRIIFDALYPVEKGWYQFRKIPKYLVKDRAKEELMLVAFGIEYDRMCQLRESPGYFDELQQTYEFLVNGQGYSPDGKSKYKLIKNYKQLSHLLKADPDCIAIVVNIEGAHALECGAPCTLHLDSGKLKESLETNISLIKSWEFPVFYVNLAHHFYNQLCGHSRSLKSPVSLMFNQELGLNEGIYDQGWFVVEKLLSKNNGRRILIDTKHMSVRARQEYSQFIAEHNKKYIDDHIPLICSHTAVNGFSTMKESIEKPDIMKKMKGSYFNNWSINLSDEEINIIHDSNGMIGLMMDKSVLGSADTLRHIKSLPTNPEKKDAFVKLFLDNLFQIIQAVGKKTAWDIICLGSDYDGAITHIDFYRDASTLEYFYMDLLDFLSHYEYRKELWYDYNPEQLLDKLFMTNVLSFLEKNFI